MSDGNSPNSLGVSTPPPGPSDPAAGTVVDGVTYYTIDVLKAISRVVRANPLPLTQGFLTAARTHQWLTSVSLRGAGLSSGGGGEGGSAAGLGSGASAAFSRGGFGGRLGGTGPGPSGVTSPASALSGADGFNRDVFGAAAPAPNAAKLRDRTLLNNVMGILTKVTNENYAKLKEELCNLPIRQSTKEEIAEIVDRFYEKALRPEDAIFVELYARLLSDLLGYIHEEERRRARSNVPTPVVVSPASPGEGVTSPASTTASAASDKTSSMIRVAILERCQSSFDSRVKDPLEDVSEEDARRKKLSSNIKFLGYLFRVRLVTESVVNSVLYSLIYGNKPDGKKHVPHEFDLIMFNDLMCTVGSLLSEKLNTYITPYFDTINDMIRRSSTSTRVRFLLMDLVERRANGWKGRAERATTGAGGAGRGAGGSPTPGTSSVPAIPLPTDKDWLEVAQRYPENEAEVDTFFTRLPDVDTRYTYLLLHVKRAANSLRRSAERKAIGQMLRFLHKQRLVPEFAAERLFAMFARDVGPTINTDDLPKVFDWVVECVDGSIVQHSALTTMLRVLVASHRPRVEILKHLTAARACVAAATAAAAAAAPSNGTGGGAPVGHAAIGVALLNRFRALPALLLYRPQAAVPVDAASPVAEDDELLMGDEDEGAETGETLFDAAVRQILSVYPAAAVAAALTAPATAGSSGAATAVSSGPNSPPAGGAALGAQGTAAGALRLDAPVDVELAVFQALSTGHVAAAARLIRTQAGRDRNPAAKDRLPFVAAAVCAVYVFLRVALYVGDTATLDRHREVFDALRECDPQMVGQVSWRETLLCEMDMTGFKPQPAQQQQPHGHRGHQQQQQQIGAVLRAHFRSRLEPQQGAAPAENPAWYQKWAEATYIAA